MGQRRTEHSRRLAHAVQPVNTLSCQPFPLSSCDYTSRPRACEYTYTHDFHSHLKQPLFLIDRVAVWRKPSLASPRPNHHKDLYNLGSAQTNLTSLCFHQQCCSDHVPHCPCPGLLHLLFPPLGLSWLLCVRQDSAPWSPPLRAVQHPIPGSTMVSVNPAARISSISDVISFICLFIMCSLLV